MKVSQSRKYEDALKSHGQTKGQMTPPKKVKSALKKPLKY